MSFTTYPLAMMLSDTFYHTLTLHPVHKFLP
jgi:hypothetical protein